MGRGEGRVQRLRTLAQNSACSGSEWDSKVRKVVQGMCFISCLSSVGLHLPLKLNIFSLLISGPRTPDGNLDVFSSPGFPYTVNHRQKLDTSHSRSETEADSGSGLLTSHPGHYPLSFPYVSVLGDSQTDLP